MSWKFNLTQIPTKIPDFIKHLADEFRSACISSTLRTYYTWKIVTSPDVTYHMVQMGLWTYAELATGVIVSCLPVIPKFFQHVGPRILATIFSQGKHSGTYDRQLSPMATSTHKEAACGFVLPSWTKKSKLNRSETLSVASTHRAYLNRGDCTSEGVQTPRADNNVSHELGELPMAGPAPKDLVGIYREF